MLLRSSEQLAFAVSAFTYSDLCYGDGRRIIRVRATLSVGSADAGGRRIPGGAKWRPNHNFGEPDGRSFYIGQVHFGSSDLNPNDTREVVIEFLEGPGLLDHLQVGRAWRVQDGPKLFAIATVVEVVGKT